MINKGETGYFVGCTSSYREKESALNTALILSKTIKEGFVLLGSEEYCCGSPLIRTGQVEMSLNNGNDENDFNIRDYISHNVSELKKHEIKTLIFNCAGCFKTITTDWEKFLEFRVPFESKHITQFLDEKIKDEEIKLKPWNKKITYHDPCHLGRYMGIYEEPRKILKTIPGVELVEMKHNREKAICCGAGGGFKGGFPSDALKIADLRIKEALDTKAEVLITSCVFCKMHLKFAVERRNAEIEVLNIEDIIVNLID